MNQWLKTAIERCGVYDDDLPYMAEIISQEVSAAQNERRASALIMDTGLAMAVMSAAKAYKTAIRQFNEADPDFIDAACHRLRAAEAHFDAVYSRAKAAKKEDKPIAKR